MNSSVTPTVAMLLCLATVADHADTISQPLFAVSLNQVLSHPLKQINAIVKHGVTVLRIL